MHNERVTVTDNKIGQSEYSECKLRERGLRLSLSNSYCTNVKAFSILTKRTVVVTFVVRDVTAKLTQIPFFFFTVSQREDLFLLQSLATSVYAFFFFLY